ncbi:hypothetical protein BCR42DRAFT_411719 [Absidia repens]|uniref:Uncharacterized protein n=1 Tax=Absidia repens TaxID=90262 RepID=A0A1X2INK3_9FUNG|nr:hypothetical protein BCR42DRAFT_411719 [Absidia repens]
MATSKSIITRDEALCLVLDMVPTDTNKRKATKIMEESPFDVVYLSELGPLRPIAMGKAIIDKNPYTYKRYPQTPPAIPILPEDNAILESNDYSSDSDSKSTSSGETSNSYSPTAIVSIAKSLFFTEVDNETLFDYDMYTTTDMYNEVKKVLPRLQQYTTVSKFGRWLATKNFGPQTTKRIAGKPVQGRKLYRVKEALIGTMVEGGSAFRHEMNNNNDGWINVGYVRKTPGKESDKCRRDLLNAMITKLQNRCFCQKIYASVSCKSDSPILERDFSDDNKTMVTSLTGCDGDAQDMIQFVSHTTKRVRLCVISYAGLSNVPDDVQLFLKSCKMIKMIVVDHDHHIECLYRHGILHGKQESLHLFKSRIGCVKRAK